jgi:long-subunit fatty acid transport protein
MNILRQFSIALLCLAFSFSAAAQSREKDKEFDKEPSRIGFGVNIGNIRFYNSAFEFGLAPNVAYRVSEAFAVGFMLKADYFYKKYRSQAVKFSAFDLGPTVFARVKPLWSWDAATPFLQGLFLQAEYEKGFLKRAYENQYGEAILDINGEIEVAEIEEDFLYLGLGASSGYPFSTFVSLHYNVLDDFDSTRLPFSYRIGFTWNY